MAGNTETAAMLRSTYALTQLEGSPAHNVLPPVARANFNVRIAPFETVADATERARHPGRLPRRPRRAWGRRR